MRIATQPVKIGADWTQVQWYDVGNVRPTFTIEIENITTGDHVQVWVSNSPTVPGPAKSAANTEGTYEGLQFGADVTANGFVKVTESYRWLTLIHSAGTGAPVAYLHRQHQDEMRQP